MRIRLARKISKRPWRYSPGKILAAAHRLGNGKVLERAIQMIEDGFWRPGPDGPQGLTYWLKENPK